MTMAMAMNDKIFYGDEMLKDEQLDNVQGGAAPALIIEGLIALAGKGASEISDIKNLVNSAEYKAMSNGDRNKKLGKELANSLALNVIIGGTATPFAGAGLQVKWRTSGTSDTLRTGIENIF